MAFAHVDLAQLVAKGGFYPQWALSELPRVYRELGALVSGMGGKRTLAPGYAEEQQAGG